MPRDRSPAESTSDTKKRRIDVLREETHQGAHDIPERGRGESSSIKDTDDNIVTTLTLASISISASGEEEWRSGSLTPEYKYIDFWQAIRGWIQRCIKVYTSRVLERPCCFSIFTIVNRFSTSILRLASLPCCRSSIDTGSRSVNGGALPTIFLT